MFGEGAGRSGQLGIFRGDAQGVMAILRCLL